MEWLYEGIGKLTEEEKLYRATDGLQNESKEVYNKKTQKRKNWFILALETGQNKRRYFPGAEVHGLVSGSSAINIYAQDNITSDVLGTIEPNTWVIIKNIAALNEQPAFYKIATSNANNALVGYIQRNAILSDNDKVYETPFL